MEDQDSPGVTRWQRTCKISRWHGMTSERSRMTGHSGRAVSPNVLPHVTGLRSIRLSGSALTCRFWLQHFCNTG